MRPRLFWSGQGGVGPMIRDIARRKRAEDQFLVRLWSAMKNRAVSNDSKEENLVDEMGFEPTTPALRTRCSPN